MLVERLAGGKREQVIGPDIIRVSSHVFCASGVFKNTHICLISAAIDDIGFAAFVLDVIVDLKTRRNSSSLSVLVYPTQCSDGLVGILSVAAGLRNASNAHCHINHLCL